jgi:hypothetical protein
MRIPFLTKLIQLNPLRWHIPNSVVRMEVIQRAINILGARRYLEIGVFDGTCFCTLDIPEKIGVDPISPSPGVLKETQKRGVRYFPLTSDDFFQRAAPLVLADGVDVVFIDGLHTYAQAFRDCMNSLKYLNQGGLILLHDCLPTSELEARVAESLDDATRLNSGFAWNKAWVGDVWKAILRLRAEHLDLQTFVLHCDYGIGVVYRGQNNSRLPHTLAQINAMTYADLANNAVQLLDVRRPRDLIPVLEKLRSERHDLVTT